jgi:hypothetical protein
MKSSETPSSEGRTEGQIRALFVARLERLLRMRRDYREDLNPLGLRLMDRAIDATYRDCLDYGAGDEARAVMSRHSTERGKPPTGQAI